MNLSFQNQQKVRIIMYSVYFTGPTSDRKIASNQCDVTF